MPVSRPQTIARRPSSASAVTLGVAVATFLLASGSGPVRGAAASASPAVAPRGLTPREEIVARFDTPARAASAARAASLELRPGGARVRVLQVPVGHSTVKALATLQRRPGVVSANPNYVARASGYVPDDPGRGTTPGGWQQLQWNFSQVGGVNAPDAWQRLIDVGRPGARGTVVAVLDTGVAYSNRGRYRLSPDLSPARFVRGYDFVDGDEHPNDVNGHGTHVASTIGESTGNGRGLTGLAYGTRIMPIRVLDATGQGTVERIARGIRYAARRGADVINLSMEFNIAYRASDLPEIVSAIRYAERSGAVVVAAAGNVDAGRVAYPARAEHVISVAATTEHLCQAEYSNHGTGLDISAPGGGSDADLPADVHCLRDAPAGRPIFQVTFRSSVATFGVSSHYIGTSMAAPHVSAVAAMVIASGVIGTHPSPGAVRRRLLTTATDLGSPGADTHYGAGLVDAAAAVGATPVRTVPATPVSSAVG